jgi:2-amino-4-hydroxy-6-hydroxymethyldihydropteridine diphosphokinase
MKHTVYIALGSNLGQRVDYLRRAYHFLKEISVGSVSASPIYESEPVGPSDNDYLNAVVRITTPLEPQELLNRCKAFEKETGRDQDAPRWSNRVIDLDIISIDELHINRGKLQVPHPSYPDRLFVLLPLRKLNPDWHDPVSGKFIEEMITCAPKIRITETNLSWDADA